MNVDNILECPSCGEPALDKNENSYTCNSCQVTYPIRDGVPVLFSPKTRIISEEASRAEFWDAGWEKRNDRLLALDQKGILEERQKYLNLLTKEGYPSAVDISPDAVDGKMFLNIGCGGGYEGLLFSGYGARYVGVDFSHNAAHFTQKLIRNGGFNGITFQAEAETLPFQDNHFDFVYSSGVLHHTPNTEQALKEVYRVLKPGGIAMIGLYPTYSVMFLWYRLHALFKGNISKQAIDNWMNANTEGEWQTEGRKNHWTRTYSKPEFSMLMESSGFENFQIKQTPLQIKVIPVIGKIITAILPAKIGEIRIGPFGGMLVATSTK
jgi:ubiquinone/menaquinone biosynthesis C-methylase UbiE/uncharacterized protein YbaR (Trm112 family)